MSSLLKVSYFQNLGELIDITVHLEQLAAKQLRTLVEAAQMAKKNIWDTRKYNGRKVFWSTVRSC